MDKPDLKRKILDSIGRGPRVTSMATIREGKPSTRPVMTWNDEHLTFFFVTSLASRKVLQIQAVPDVHLQMAADPASPESPVLQVAGRAVVLTDEATRRAAWRDGLKAYFHGPDDPDYAVVRIEPECIELWSNMGREPAVLTFPDRDLVHWPAVIDQARQGIFDYLDQGYARGELREELYRDARARVIPNLEAWVLDPDIARLSPNLALGVKKAVEAGRWEHLVYAFMDEIAFGTGGIRGIAAFTQGELEQLAAEGLDAPILKGPNTVNSIEILLKTTGVGRYIRTEGLTSGVVVGYDSRIRGVDYAELVARALIHWGVKVYLFDEACPFPELTFAVPTLKADLGILISASHNDRRYNGYKLTNNAGAQLSYAERNKILNDYIVPTRPAEIRLAEMADARPGQLVYLGGAEPLAGFDYHGQERIDMHSRHVHHVETFLADRAMVREQAPRTRVGYCAYYGAGRKATPRLLQEIGFSQVNVVHSLNELDGMFPKFMLEQQPDPGDPVAAEVAVEEYIKEYGAASFHERDIFLGTDPDADRAGVIVPVPADQQPFYRQILARPAHLDLPRPPRTDFSWVLLDADIAWTVLLWYRFHKEVERFGAVPDADRKFLALSHTTTDNIIAVGRKFGIGAVKTWVGFAMLADAVLKAWDGIELTHAAFPKVICEVHDMNTRRVINVGAMEQSNGFSILGEKAEGEARLGRGGHVRDKDGTFAAVLMAEVAAYARSRGTTVLELIDREIYLDPEIGCYLTYYEPAPNWGQYEGPAGMSRKITYLRRMDEIRQAVDRGEKVELAGRRVVSSRTYRTGKYDSLHRWEGFPDEGIRLYFDATEASWFTLRPSGTAHSLRFHCQLKVEGLAAENIGRRKAEAYAEMKAIVADVRKRIGVDE